MSDCDVAICGGGPVGLLLALSLCRAGCAVKVLEASPNRDDLVHKGILGARAINVTSATILHEIGVLDEIRARALWWLDTDSLSLQGSDRGFIGHFSGLPIRRMNIDPAMLARFALGVGTVAIADIIAVLETALADTGTQVTMGEKVTGFFQDAEGIVVQTDARTVRAKWLVACDGGRSTLRKCAGIPFPGTDAEFTAVSALVQFSSGEELPVRDWVETDRGTYLHAPEGRLIIVEYGASSAGGVPVSLEEVITMLHRVTGSKSGIVRLIAGQRFTDAARQVESYRKGRLFLAGDAAHIHSPAGGQGLNQGFGDAITLAPLLARVVKGEQAESTLDAYDAMRRPIGKAILDWTRAQSALGRPDPNSRALRRVIAELLNNRFSTSYVLGRINGDWC
jgi:2-polyprenyl-6-methoxyphenol hydroxylase-like FAD-dependent oxidoreductase